MTTPTASTTPRFLSAFSAALILSCGLAAAGQPTARLDCRADNDACPEILIQGDPHFSLPGLHWSPFYGYGDPSIRKDPASSRLWLSYSYLSLHPWPHPEFGLSIHLASSADGGDSWSFERALTRSAPQIDPSPASGLGVSVQEVSTLAPLESGGNTRWFGMHLRYFQPFGEEERRPDSIQFRLARANRPWHLGRTRQARLGAPITHPAWRTDVDLSTLDPELARCTLWTEPALYGLDETLYMIAQCLVVDASMGARDADAEFLGVFASDGRGPIAALDWRWLGRLSGRREAGALGGHVLTQADVARARDGSLLLLVTPKRLASRERHLGCRVLELESLDPPRLRRDTTGRPIVRADIRSSDSTGLGPGLCAYDPASSTGVLFVRTEIDLSIPDIAFRLHATGIHP